jgi:hypothetical protein
MAKASSLDHATHNEKVCTFLDGADPAFKDWVITTSFYSALHYLRERVFPFNLIVAGNKIKIDNFEYYHSVCSMAKGKKSMGRHERFRELVSQKCDKGISSYYDRLLELSFTARYTDYNYPKEISDDALLKLNEIKTYCIKKKN